MANYHVNYLTGSDVTGDGSVSTPWATITYALTTSAATTGDVIKVAGSTTTDIDTGATFATNDRTNQLTTSTDLTSQLSVGDVIMISPNIPDGPEFDGWMLTEVEAITATVLTTRGYHVYPNQTSLAVTITKINDQVVDGNYESISNPNDYVGVVIECGYDATFTSVIGKTYFVNSNVGVGARSGTKFTLTNLGSAGKWDTVQPLFKNIAFCKYDFGINPNQFGVMAYASNIALLNCEAGAGSYATYYGPATDGTSDIYFNDCSGSIMNINYNIYAYQNDKAALNGAPLRLFLNQNRDRQIENNTGQFQDIVGYGQRGNIFGWTVLLQRSLNLYGNGSFTLMGLDRLAYTSDYYRTPSFAHGSVNFTVNNFKIVRNGGAAADYAFNFALNSGEQINGGNCYIKLPTGTTVNDYVMTGQSAMVGITNTSTTYVDDNGVWAVAEGGAFVKQNVVDQETGNSCLELLVTPGKGYGDGKFTPFLAMFPATSGGQRLTGMTFRYKKIGDAATGFRLQTPVGNYSGPVLATLNFSSTSWANSTATFAGIAGAWIESLPATTYIPFYLKASSTYTYGSHTLIDSITPIYS